MVAILAVGILGVIPAAAVPAVPGPGFQDFQYNPGPDSSTGGDAVTGSRNQSKLWFNDGLWWAVMFDKTNAANPTYRIQSLNMATQTWTTGATATQADKRNKSHADVLSDGTTLWMASSHKSGANVAPNGDLQVFKFTYNATTKKYTIVAGFPKVVAQGGTDAATIAMAPNGRLWVAYTQDDAAPATTAHVRVVSSTTSAGTIWTAPFELPGGTAAIGTNDLAAITNVNGGVGVFWSNQNVSDHAFYFQVHLDPSAPNVWQPRETAYNPTSGADGHMSVKTNTNGDVIAAVKTSQTGANPLIGVLRRTAAGTWEPIHTVADSTGSPDPTRPILVIDSENNEANVFMTSQVNGGFTTRRTAPLTTLDFGTPASGPAFIRSTADPLINDPTSTKQVTTVASGIVVLASDRTATIRRYLHGCAGSICPAVPVAAFSGTPLTGEGPLTVQFTDASTGNPGTWLWDFGDGSPTSALQNPSHTFNPGTWTVSLTVTNVLGSDAEVKVDYVVVSVPTAATYTAVTPARVLDTRVGTGLSGKFVSGMPRSFQVTGVGGVPSNAVAITGNLTVVNQSKGGFVFLGPTASTTPTSSTINFPVGDTRANAVTVALDPDGKLGAVFQSSTGATTHLLLDVTGYFVRNTAGATYKELTPARVLDTRVGTGLSGKFVSGAPRNFQVTGAGGVPAGAVAITGNLTVVNQSNGGFVFLGPTATSSPTSSTINFPIGDTRANAVTVALSGTGQLGAVFMSSTGANTHLLLDVTGYFVADLTGSRYIALEPIRLLDTRVNNGLTGKFTSSLPRSFDVAGRGGVPLTAVAVTGNLTVVNQSNGGFVFLGPTAPVTPTSSTINFPVGDTRANAVTVALSGTGQLGAVYKSSTGATTHLLLDVTGYFVP
ncbi:MAG: PKD domain-containing protein [Chloroflexota bacterium]